MPRKRLVPMLAAAALFLVWLLLLRPAFLGGSTSYIILSGISMQPTLQDGDLVLARSLSSYSSGDIVAFQTGGGVVIHRIIGGSAAEGYLVQGDNKDNPDGWRPTPADVLGKTWLRIPGAGKWFAVLRQPYTLGLLVGGLTAVFLFIGKEPRRSRTRKTKSRRGRSLSGAPPIPQGALPAGFLLLLALGLAAGALVWLRQPAETSRYVEHQRYKHIMAFAYTIHGEPSTLYPDGTIGPVRPGSGKDEADGQAPPIYTRLARSLELDFTYALKGPAPGGLAGTISAGLEIRSPEGWAKTSSLLAPLTFKGNTVSSRVVVDLKAINSLVKKIEGENGVGSGSYELAVIPRIKMKGRMAGQLLQQAFRPTFAAKIDGARITPQSRMVQEKVRSFGVTEIRKAAADILGVPIPVRALGWLSAILAAIALSAATAFALPAFFARGRGEAAKIQRRHGSRLVTVAKTHLNGQGTVIRVASMKDLMKLAEREGEIVLHQRMAGGSHLYFVREGVTTYEYEAPECHPRRRG